MAKNQLTFVKLLDEFPGHPKIVGLSDAAFRAYIEALCYCSRYLTDGAIPEPAARRFASARSISELVSVGLLDRHSGSVHIHDYLEHQTSREHVEIVKAKRAQAGRKGGANG